MSLNQTFRANAKTALSCALFAALAVLLAPVDCAAASRNSLGGENQPPIVAANGALSLALDRNGKVYAAGENNSGQLGLGDKENRDAFTEVADLSDKDIAAIATGGLHSLALDRAGRLYATGVNTHGQLGFIYAESRKRFAKVPFLGGVTAIAAGGSHSFAIASGKVYAAGWNYGQLGVGEKGDPWKFTEIKSLSAKEIVAIAAGAFHTLALGANGKVYATGANRDGRLGFDDNANRETFELVASLEGITVIAAGNFHSLALSSEGKLYASGYNKFGQLGVGDNDDRWKFAEVKPLEGAKIVAIAAGFDHSLALDENGKVYATGDNGFGELGLGDTRKRNVWTLVGSLSDKKIVAIAAGAVHSLAFDASGKLYAAGNNSEGQLGLSGADERNVFTPVPLPDR
jgi:alpha-tubulin suppressor-like RCC1 family protein